MGPLWPLTWRWLFGCDVFGYDDVVDDVVYLLVKEVRSLFFFLLMTIRDVCINTRTPHSHTHTHHVHTLFFFFFFYSANL